MLFQCSCWVLGASDFSVFSYQSTREWRRQCVGLNTKESFASYKRHSRQSVAQPPETVKVVGLFSVQVDSF